MSWYSWGDRGGGGLQYMVIRLRWLKIDLFIFCVINTPIFVHSRNLSVNSSHAGVHVAQGRWGVVQVSFNQC